MPLRSWERCESSAPMCSGWSLGGFVAQELAIRHPLAVRRLVLASSSAGGRTATTATRKVLLHPTIHTSQLLVYKDAGHAFLIQHATQFAAAVLHFLRQP
jgi:pimeloyl-ACP methyl ester carboxylesterase